MHGSYFYPDYGIQHYDALIQTESARLIAKQCPQYQSQSQDAGDERIDEEVSPIGVALETGR